MAEVGRNTCSQCGAPLIGSSSAALSLCPACQTVPLDGTLPATVITEGGNEATEPITESKVTVVGSTISDPSNAHVATVDFVPASSPTEPLNSGTAQTPIVSKTRIGRFRVTDILGSGAFGTVYRAYDPLLDREVALKVPRFSSDDHGMMERFHREAKAAARLHHPNIVTLYEHGTSEDGPYLVNEFVDGAPLSAMLGGRRVEFRTAVDWVRQIAEALHYAHSEGIVHRDVKPSNIMMNRAGRPRVMDFGLAKRDADVESRMTVEGQVVGTPTYMSPEQARGTISKIGPHSDQYSVAVILYEMLCGRTPYAGPPWMVMACVANEKMNPPSLRSLHPEIPRDLEACCLRAMEKDPRSRYPDLQAFANDLEHWLKGLPLIARPLSPAERLLRWCRANQLIAGLEGALATLIIVAAIVGYWLAFQFQDLAGAAKRDADDAKQARELEKNARLATERSIIDTYTETGLMSDRNGNPREAILWFANAVAAAENHPLREKHNRIRVQSWLSQIPTPVQAFQQPSMWNKTLAYHPSGKLLLSLSLTGECDLLRLSDGKQLSPPIDTSITAATWSPDGKLLALASYREVTVFELMTDQAESDQALVTKSADVGLPTKELDRWSHDDSVNVLQFSADSQLLVVGGDSTVQVRDLPKKSFRTELIELDSQVSAAAISRDGCRFAVRCDDQQVHVFSSAPEQASSKPLMPPQHAASEGLLSPFFVGNDRLVVVDCYHAVRCWNIDRKNVVWEQDVKRVLSAAMSSDEKWLALGEDFELVVLDAESGKPAETRMKHPNLINNISFHPQKSLVLTACEDHTARLFELPSGKPVGQPVPHNKSVHRCTWSPDGRTFATVHWGGEIVRIWKPALQQAEEFEATPTARGPFVRFNQAGDRWLPSGFDSGRDCVQLQVFDAKSGQAVGPTLTGPGLLSSADFVPNSPVVVLAGGGTHDDAARSLPDQKLYEPGFVRFVNSETGKPVFPDVATPSQPIAVRTSPDGRTVVALCHQGHVLLLDTSTGQVTARQQAFRERVASYRFIIRDRIRFSTRGDQFILWGCQDTIELRKTADGELLFEFSHGSGFIHDALFSPDGRLVATCSSDTSNSVRLWDTSSGTNHGPSLKHSGWVFNAQFSHDGRRLLTAASDKQARIWDVAQGTAILATREHQDQVFCATFLPGEELFLVSSRAGEITAWDAAYGKMVAPIRVMPSMVYQLSQANPATNMLASGTLNPIRGFDWNRWIRLPDTRLSRDDVRLLGELLSSQRVHEGGAATPLSSVEWWERWTAFRSKHPDYLTLD